MHVVATAGHVDHGKSTLLRALTGMEPDRWAEERARGLTIDLGFVWAELEPGGAGDGVPAATVAFVDVPGHERFIANMLAGAGAVRLALFVVAADDGWSAQSQEHLDILDLLGVSGAVVAVTKAGLAGEDRALEVAVDVEARLAETTLAGAPIVVTDALDGTGLAELSTTLLARLVEVPAVADRRRGRLWIDRAFTISGAGTVVTGTLAGGALTVGDEIAILPAGHTARVRGLQALGRPVEQARPGDRVAVNVSGLDRGAVGRGDALVTGGQPPAAAWLVTETVDAWVRALPGQQLDRAGAWHLHVGSAETVCTVHPILGEPIVQGRPGHVRLRLEEPLPLQTGDRLVLREAGRRATVAGGEVLDPAPPGRVRGVDQRLARAEHLDVLRAAEPGGTAGGAAADRPSTPGGRLVPLVRAWGGLGRLPEVRAAAGQRPDAPLPEGVTRIGRALLTDEAAARWGGAVLAAGRAHHQQHPASPGASRDELAAAAREAGCPDPEAARELVDHLAGRGELRRHGPSYALPEHVPAVDEARQERRAAFLALLAATPLAPPRLAEATRESGLDHPEVQRLVQTGEIVKCGEIAFLPEAIESAVARLRALEAEVGPFTAAQAKDAWTTTRKYAIPLLEHLDGVGTTRFDGQHRTVREHPHGG